MLDGSVLTKASQLSIHDRYANYHQDAVEEIPPLCSGNTKRTMGIQCIHIIKVCVEMKRSSSLDQFHEQWYLYHPEDLPPVNPRLIVLEPRVVVVKESSIKGDLNFPFETVFRTRLQVKKRLLSSQKPTSDIYSPPCFPSMRP